MIDCTNEEDNEVGACFNQDQSTYVQSFTNIKGILKTSGFQIIPPSKHCSSPFN